MKMLIYDSFLIFISQKTTSQSPMYCSCYTSFYDWRGLDNNNKIEEKKKKRKKRKKRKKKKRKKEEKEEKLNERKGQNLDRKNPWQHAKHSRL